MFSVVAKLPVVAGMKYTYSVHEVDGASELPQVDTLPLAPLSMRNEALDVVMLLIATVPPATLLGLLTVIALSVLGVPWNTTPNWFAPGTIVNPASVPVPFSDVGELLVAKALVTLRVPVTVPCAV